MSQKWGDQDSDGPTTESLERRDRKVREDGVVEGIAWVGIVAGACGMGVALIILLVYFL